MAAEVLVGAVVEDGVSKLSDTIIHVINQTWLFKRKLTQVQDTIKKNKPYLDEIEKLTRELGRGIQRTETFRDLMKNGEALVLKCVRIKWNLWKKYTHSKKLSEFNASLLSFCQIDVQLESYMEMLRTKNGDPAGRWRPRVPLPKGDVIGFDDQLRKLKEMVLRKDSDDCSVIVVSAARGCGKTTLVTMMCHDSEIKARFGRNIYFATISENANLKIVVQNLLGRNQAADFINEEDAINQWGSFLGENGSGNTLLVLDDVRSDSIINRFKFKLHGYKILATARTTYKQFSTYRLQPLSDQDATTLFRQSAFRQSAFSECASENIDNDIPDDVLVDKLVKCCKNRPLVLSVIGDLLKGRHKISWVAMLNILSNGQQSDEFFTINQIRQFISDLGLFPDDQQVSAKMLMDKWVHLDEPGLGTTHQFFQRYLNTPEILSPIRRNSTCSGSLMGGAAPLGDAISRLSDAIINTQSKKMTIWKTSYCKAQLDEIQDIIRRNKPFFDAIEKLIEALDRPKQEKERFIAQLKSAQDLVLKCGRGKLNLYKRPKYLKNLDSLTESLRRFCVLHAPWVVGKGILDLLVARDLQNKRT